MSIIVVYSCRRGHRPVIDTMDDEEGIVRNFKDKEEALAAVEKNDFVKYCPHEFVEVTIPCLK